MKIQSTFPGASNFFMGPDFVASDYLPAQDKWFIDTYDARSVGSP